MSKITISKGSTMESCTVEDIDLDKATARELTEEAVNCGFLGYDFGTDWFLVSNKTNQPIFYGDVDKSLSELGFTEGDNIRFICRGMGGADGGMVISGGNTPEVVHTERLIRDSGITDAATSRLLLSKSTLLSRLFPSAQQRIIADFKKQSVQQASDFYLRLSKLTHEAELQALTERYNAALSVIKGQYRSDVVRFARSKFEEVQNHLNEIQDRDLKRLEEIYKSCQSMSVPAFRKKYEETLSKQFDITVEFQLKLIDEFVSFLNNKLSVPETSLMPAH